MDAWIELLKSNNIGILATSVNNTPHARPHHIHHIQDKTFYFTTANTKESYAQLLENPQVEFVAIVNGYSVIRISGRVSFGGEKEKQLVLDNSELVRRGYKTADNPVYEVFYLEHGEISFLDMASGKPMEKHIF